MTLNPMFDPEVEEEDTDEDNSEGKKRKRDILAEKIVATDLKNKNVMEYGKEEHGTNDCFKLEL